MRTSEILNEYEKSSNELERIKLLENNSADFSEKAEFIRKNCIKGTIAGTIFHMFGFLFHPVLPFIGLSMYLIVIVGAFKMFSLEDKAEKLQTLIKEKRDNLRKGNVETLLCLPSPRQDIQYQESITTYDKKISKLNKR